jgi:hypothetical protein
MLKKLLLSSIITIILSTAAKANLEENFIINSTHYNWVVFENKSHQGKECYIASFPIKVNKNKNFKNYSYAMVTLFKRDKVQEFSSTIGIKFKLNSPSILLVGDRKFELFTDGEFIWLKTKQDDKNLIKLMLENAYFKIRSNSAFGSFSIDEYSLKGFNMAYARMKATCKKEYKI